MREEQYGRSASSPIAPDSALTASAAADAASGMPVAAPKVDCVSSDQLWRAAVMAARQAATTAAELRRALDDAAADPPT